MTASVTGQHRNVPAGMTCIKVIARLPALSTADPSAAAAPPQVSPQATAPVEPAQSSDDHENAVEPVIQPVTTPSAKASNSFPLRSIVALAMLAAISWTAAWWSDRQRLLAERALEARHEQAAVEPRPERLARELPSGAAAHPSVKP